MTDSIASIMFLSVLLIAAGIVHRVERQHPAASARQLRRRDRERRLELGRVLRGSRIVYLDKSIVNQSTTKEQNRTWRH